MARPSLLTRTEKGAPATRRPVSPISPRGALRTGRSVTVPAGASGTDSREGGQQQHSGGRRRGRRAAGRRMRQRGAASRALLPRVHLGQPVAEGLGRRQDAPQQ